MIFHSLEERTWPFFALDGSECHLVLDADTRVLLQLSSDTPNRKEGGFLFWFFICFAFFFIRDQQLGFFFSAIYYKARLKTLSLLLSRLFGSPAITQPISK